MTIDISKLNQETLNALIERGHRFNVRSQGDLLPEPDFDNPEIKVRINKDKKH